MHPFDTKIMSVCVVTKVINTDLEGKDAEHFNIKTFS